MLLKKLLFDNYKTYYGCQEIDFYIPKQIREDQGKNIILLGGLNGAGKTTILKAIHYSLFGKRGISEEEHKKLFSNVINNVFFDEGGRSCSVTLILETDNGEEWELKTQWSFDHNKRCINESREITIRKPGVKIGKQAHIDNIEAFNRFIDKMIPFHAAPFFIFDGEEIKDIIIRQDSSEMKEAIHKITGLEAYKQLLSDLSSMKSSLEQNLAKAVNQEKLKNVQEELAATEQEMQTLEKRKSESIVEKNKLEALIHEAKTSRNEKIANNSKSREVIIKKQAQLSTQYQIETEEFVTLFKENVLSIILSEKIVALKKRLKTEHDSKQRRIIQDSALVPYRNFINQLFDTPISPPLSDVQLSQIKSMGEEIWAKENNITLEVSNIEEIHDITQSEYTYLMNLPVQDQHRIVSSINKIEKLSTQLSDIEQELRNAPESVDITEENQKIDTLTKKLGEIDLKLRNIQAKLNRSKETKTNLLNQLTRVSDQNNDYVDLTSRLEYVDRLIKTINQYVSEMTHLKAVFIKEEFASMLNQLFRKQDEFGVIEFDIQTYSIKLYNDKLQEISIQERSAGEMQMIASSLIWALTKASDLSLPMVIDTPLGRLDSYHRNHLINYYYKELSEQVIILSTDTEISQDYVDLMKNSSHRQYLLDYDQNRKYTIIRDGYFDFVKV
ncbi:MULTISPECIES: DNA sulfur modification protein DndD [Brevibacillus]|uniref:DNA sulfur modification protein DndD n=1 Tax=Brevibacillus TaxID=55080 RepID=UPI000EB93EB9|nr:DNA sulfur modification protein DndD [Brevibacillus sp.]HBZ83223.1 DNA sulfur modification protein DndD [Brevibacillus sp.]